MQHESNFRRLRFESIRLLRLIRHAGAACLAGAALLSAAPAADASPAASRAAAYAAAPALPPGARPQPGDLVLLHTNDTHSYAAGVDRRGNPCDRDEKCFGGYARLAAAISREKAAAEAAGADALALDAGDRWQGTLFFNMGGPELITRMERLLPWDAATLGNHEFDRGCAEAKAAAEHAPFPILAANIEPHEGCPLPGGALAPWQIFDFPGGRVGVFGIANDEGIEVAQACPETRFSDRAEAARRAVAALEAQGVTRIIALTHIGYAADQALAREVAGIDVIVGGHTHSLLGGGFSGSEGPYPTVVRGPDGGRTLILQAKRSTEYLGKLRITFDRNGRAAAWYGAPMRLTPDLPRDTEAEAAVEETAKKVEAFRSEKIAFNPNHFSDGLDPCRAGDCLGGMTAADAYLAAAPEADIALINGGSVRTALPVGPVSRGDLHEMLPFANRLVLLELSGADLLKALENSVSDPDMGVGPRLLQPACLRYYADPRRPAGERILKAETRPRTGGAWTPVDPNRTYKVVMEAFLANGGDKYAMFAAAKHLPMQGILETEALERWLESQPDGVLAMPETGRINWIR